MSNVAFPPYGATLLRANGTFGTATFFIALQSISAIA